MTAIELYEIRTKLRQSPAAMGELLGVCPAVAPSTACSQVFPLTTLRDIFNLPTFEQMVVCLDELKDCMMQARATNDLMVALVAEKGIAVEKALEWPEVLEWKDDGKGEVGTAYAGPDGKEIFSMKASRDPANV